ncbi:hypothetical protein QAD02_024241 [Eretmocerus hayati]|uniref:Uncharacterized protein n=1 Tax=Eretmocerus hayati TaxID=131215 RepID=A0ACC2PY28_9HYME|nr:hypothetical protein QAD02_024241 [Eretmocerus hayati]
MGAAHRRSMAVKPQYSTGMCFMSSAVLGCSPSIGGSKAPRGWRRLRRRRQERNARGRSHRAPPVRRAAHFTSCQQPLRFAILTATALMSMAVLLADVAAVLLDDQAGSHQDTASADADAALCGKRTGKSLRVGTEERVSREVWALWGLVVS